jgi:hypothetical protein
MQVCCQLSSVASSLHYTHHDKEDWQATIDEKKADLHQKVEYGSNDKISKEKQHMLNNDISMDPIDGESIEGQTKHRATIFRE